MRALCVLVVATLLCCAAAAGELAEPAGRKLRFADAVASNELTSAGARQLNFFAFLPQEVIACLEGGLLATVLSGGNPMSGLGGCALTSMGTGMTLEIITLVCHAMPQAHCALNGGGQGGRGRAANAAGAPPVQTAS